MYCTHVYTKRQSMTSYMNNTFSTPITEEAIANLPIIDLHVHLPGTISPYTAWQLGVRNHFLTITTNEDGHYVWCNGPNSLPIEDPFEHYSDIFKKNDDGTIYLGENGIPVNLEYNIDVHSFKSFDRVMATIQGHRHPPGGIQNEADIEFVLDMYLQDCIKQNVIYTELQQNIKIAHQLYPALKNEDARTKLYLFLQNKIKEFARHGVTLRFLHCFNKTQAAGIDITTHERALEAAQWLQEAQELTPEVFVGIESAGHEKDESGWPIHLKAGYDKIKALNLGCEAHAGEGIGVEHMLDVIRTLPISRLAHGFQVIEDQEAIEETIEKQLTLIMMPMINLTLGACIHGEIEEDGQIKPLAKSKGGKKHYIMELHQHPFFILLRHHKLTIALSSDNPYIGGVPIKDSIRMLAGLNPHDDGYKHFLPFTSENFSPLTLEELYQCSLNAINAAFCSSTIKENCQRTLNEWFHGNINK